MYEIARFVPLEDTSRVRPLVIEVETDTYYVRQIGSPNVQTVSSFAEALIKAGELLRMTRDKFTLEK